MNAAAADISDVEHQIFRELPLQNQIPLLIISVFALRFDGENLIAEPCVCTERVAGCDLNALRKRVGQKNRRTADLRGLRRLHQSLREICSLRRRPFERLRQKENAVTAAQSRFFVETVSKTDARRETGRDWLWFARLPDKKAVRADCLPFGLSRLTNGSVMAAVLPLIGEA